MEDAGGGDSGGGDSGGGAGSGVAAGVDGNELFRASTADDRLRL